ncbi:hypothetical protein BGW38_009597 [Lunasporangiospora selenospora]|uniref:Uncharacterized protein n=1 Tax=Lunasporangiospora selenospora TaxID=979761 RepID=A0A9P6KF90_9FUNG|nr:hypothetical protein BGW38_009597 [Lunasporangiospora selenospora]
MRHPRSPACLALITIFLQYLILAQGRALDQALDKKAKVIDGSDSPSSIKTEPQIHRLPGIRQRRQSLFSHVNDDLALDRETTTDASAKMQGDYHRVTPGQHRAEPVLNNNNNNNNDADDYIEEDHQKGDHDVRTVIEPRFPSIDLFEDDEDDEAFALSEGQDGVLRKASTTGTTDNTDSADNEDGSATQVWMVDEWEEDLEGDMDELIGWAEDEEETLMANTFTEPILENSIRREGENNVLGVDDSKINQMEASILRAKIMGNHRLRDQSSIRSLFQGEEDSRRFQRYFSKSWLF